MLQTIQRFSQENQRTQRWTPLYSHQRGGERGRERAREGVWGQLVIEGEREEEGERAVRWLQRLDSQVDCI